MTRRLFLALLALAAARLTTRRSDAPRLRHTALGDVYHRPLPRHLRHVPRTPRRPL